MVDVVGPAILSGVGVAVVALAYVNRNKPAWQRDMRRILILGLGQVALGFTSWLVLTLAK